MSNAGKSYRSHVLQEHMGFLWYQVDEEIQKALQFQTMEEISSWLGYPTEDTYSSREQKYLILENQFTKNAAMHSGGKNLVFDTTGSVTHLEKNTLETLRGNCLVVHLDVGEDSLESMIENFFLKPKPVCWGNYFGRNDNESPEIALKRCYPVLLHDRLKNYRALAHLNIPATLFFDTSAEETLAIIKSNLP